MFAKWYEGSPHDAIGDDLMMMCLEKEEYDPRD